MKSGRKTMKRLRQTTLHFGVLDIYQYVDSVLIIESTILHCVFMMQSINFTSMRIMPALFYNISERNRVDFLLDQIWSQRFLHTSVCLLVGACHHNPENLKGD